MKKPLNSLLGLFMIWRIGLFLAAFIGQFIWTFKTSFPYFDKELTITGLPNWLWGFGNFDGVHYLRIAKYGYSLDFTQVFFPVFPMLIKLFSFVSPFWAGLIISNLACGLSLYLLFKLWKLDYSQNIVYKSLILLLALPTAFYFGSIYNESLFLCLVIGCFYFLRQKKWLVAGSLAGLASGTRIVGILLMISFLIESWPEIKEWKRSALAGLALSPLGLVFYMLYLQLQFKNPIYFLTAQVAFGANRNATSLVLLPQVIFRYLKILKASFFQPEVFLTALFELGSTLVVLTILIWWFRKIRLSYLVFSLGCILIPTLTGTFSSMPRYVLMAFLIIPIIVQGVEKYYKLTIVLMWVLQLILVSLFVRGYFIA